MKNLTYLLMALLIMSCNTEPISEEIITADAKANVEKGKGKPQRAVYLKPSIQNNLRTFNGRILEQPVAYTGDFVLSQTIDFDNDGIDDEVTLVKRCYFPRTFLEVLVNGEVVSYSTNFGAKVLGFQDVDLDGFTDVVYQYGATQAYNHGEVYSEFNVGYNRPGTVIPLKDIIQSLVIDITDPNPDFIKWDLSEFGIYNYTFHVYFYNKSLTDGYGYQQTMTYGEWGVWSKDRLQAGNAYVLRFTNLGDDCSDISVEFTL